MKRASFILLITVSLCYAPGLYAQQPLSRTVSFRVTNKPVDTLLAIISRQGKCSFSFAGSPFRGDSMVTFHVTQKPVKQVLDLLFAGRIQYVESGETIILRKAEMHREKNYVISGYVRDKESGQVIPNVSIYDNSNLASTFTNNEGFFHLRLKDKGRQPSIQITVSKEFYMDTALYVLPGFDREISVAIAPAKTLLLKEFTVSDQVEKTWLGKRLLSEGLRRQTQNISKFFANKPIQTSLIPELGSHGKMAGQVVNKFSLNLIGGYSAGLNGVEIAGAFNIDKMDVQHVQIGGLFNMVGGKMEGVQISGGYNQLMKSVNGVQISGGYNKVRQSVKGVQISGGYNHVLQSVKGVQIGGVANVTKGSITGVQITGGLNIVGDTVYGVLIGGLSNHVKGKLNGVQIAGAINQAGDTVKGAQISGISNFNRGLTTGVSITGIYNQSQESMHGWQLAGIANYTGGDLQGAQLSGIGNIASGSVSGLQLGMLFNKAQHLKGVQVSIVNIADTSSGTSIGLLNIIRKGGYYKLAVDANDLMPLNLTFKSGRKHFYSLLTAGINNDSYSAGLGIGRLFPIRKNWAITTEVVVLNIFDKDGGSLAQVYRFQPQLSYQVTKWFSIHAGPAISITSYMEDISKLPGREEHKWLGWQAGISFF